jgi:acyl carrier protein
MSSPDDSVEAPPFRDWLIARLAYYLNYDPAHLDHAASLSDYGLDSVYAAAVRGDVQERFGVRLDARTVRDHPSVDLLVSLMITGRGAAVPVR